MLTAHTIKDLKEKYFNIKSILVIPYIDTRCNYELYDGSVYPPIENVPKKFAILKRNEWMINQADTVIVYVKYSYGGAMKMYEYSIRKNKNIINLYNN